MRLNKNRPASFLLKSCARDPLNPVDPFNGTYNGGNIFAGENLPYDMAKAVADVDGDNTGGFATYDSSVTGFSSMQSFTRNFPIFPQICEYDMIDSYKLLMSPHAISHINSLVVATPGYFALGLSNGMVKMLPSASMRRVAV